MALELESDKCICFRCATAYGRRKGNFPVCYAGMYRGVGYLPYCKTCVDSMYNEYLAQCGDAKRATRQMCRKLDLYWNETIFDSVEKKSTTRTAMTNYIQRVNNIAYAGKSYDDTLLYECTLWSDLGDGGSNDTAGAIRTERSEDNSDGETALTMADIPPGVIEFWGPGYTPKMYNELEQRLQYYRGQLPEGTQTDLGAEALLRQIAMMEIDINRARADGRPVDKMVNSLNSLVASLNKPLKGSTPDTSTANTPFGVWIKRWEDERPLPEIDDSMKDVDGVMKYVLTWVYGHLAHMLKIKNARTPLYEEAVSKLRVEHPEYDDEDDETMLYDLFGDGDPDGEINE